MELHIIASWESKKAFASHFDHNDVFIFQTEGHKLWNVYENRYEEPLTGTEHNSSKLTERIDEMKGNLLMQPELTPGDVLYLPKGQYYDALASSEATLHLSYRLEHCTGRDYLKMILANLGQVPLLREPLPSVDDSTAHDAHIAGLTEELARLIASPEARQYLANFQKFSSTQDGFGSFHFPSEAQIQFYRVRHEADFSKAEISQAVLEWVRGRDFFAADELDAFVSAKVNRADLLSALVDAELIESRL